MRSFEINGVSVLVAYNWNISDVINSRSIFDGTIVDKQSLSAVETGQEIIIATTEGNARDIGDGTFLRTSNATMQDGTIVTANVTRFETGQFGQAAMVEEGAANLLTANQSDVETDTTGFTINGTATVTRVTTEHWRGAAALRVQTDTDNYGVYVYNGVQPAGTYTFSVYLKGTGNVYLILYDGTNAYYGATITLTSTWTKYSISGSMLNAIVIGHIRQLGAGTADIYCDGLQIEQKAYATSWIQGGATRAAETLTIPTAGVLSATEGTIECWLKPDWLNSDTVNRVLFAVQQNVPNISTKIFAASTNITFRANGLTVTTPRSNLIEKSWNHFALTWKTDGTVCGYLNGVNIGTGTYSSIPIWDTSIYVGANTVTEAEEANGLIDDLRISNIARTDAEILAAYNSGVALPVDIHTTAKMAFDGTLEIFARPIIFAGTIDAPEAIESDPGYLYYPITAVDYNQIADKRLYAASHENTLAGNIVSAIISAKLSAEGITAGSIEDGPVISKANFNYKKCSEALDYLKDVTGMNWNINFNKQLNFFSNSTNLAPWILNDTVQHSDFRIKKNRSQYRNRQYVRAGTGKTTSQTLEKPSPAPDGSSRSFVLRFPVAEKPVVYINSTAVLSANVGVNGLDTNKSWYFSYSSNVVSQASTTAVLTSGSTLEITYTGLYPIIMLIDDPAQIASRAAVETGTSGIYENLHTEKSINERSQAIEYAEGLILRYGIIPSTITFDTEVPGLQAGQLLPIQKTLFSINSSYLIESVDISAADAEKTSYSIKCLDGSALGGWEQFFKDLINKNAEYIIQENEVIVTLNVQTETENWGSQTTITTFESLYPSDTLYPSETLYPLTSTDIEILYD